MVSNEVFAISNTPLYPQSGLTDRRELNVIGEFGRRVSEAKQSQPDALARDSTGNHTSIANLVARPSRLWYGIVQRLRHS